MDTKYLEIVKAPVITEKSAYLGQEKNQYVFKVKVVAVRTLNVKPKKRRVGRYSGLTNRTKKAMVTLAAGQQIELN